MESEMEEGLKPDIQINKARDRVKKTNINTVNVQRLASL